MVFELGCQQRMVAKSLMPDEQKEEKDLPFRKPRHFSLSRSERLLSKIDFSAVFATPSGRFSASPLRLLYRNNNLGFSRIGIIVPKKIIRLSTERNRYKRLVREQFRQVKECLPNVDIIFLLSREANEIELKRGCDRVWEFLEFKGDG